VEAVLRYIEHGNSNTQKQSVETALVDHVAQPRNTESEDTREAAIQPGGQPTPYTFFNKKPNPAAFEDEKSTIVFYLFVDVKRMLSEFRFRFFWFSIYKRPLIISPKQFVKIPPRFAIVPSCTARAP
jgi:hypothetical protein